MGNKEILDLLYGDINELTEIVSRHRKDATIFLYFMKSIIENTTVREAFCKYDVIQVETEYPEVKYERMPHLLCVGPESRFLTMGCTLKLVKREKPLELDNRTWDAIASDMICWESERINAIPGNKL